jgi:hypothetical protein
LLLLWRGLLSPHLSLLSDRNHAGRLAPFPASAALNVKAIGRVEAFRLSDIHLSPLEGCPFFLFVNGARIDGNFVPVYGRRSRQTPSRRFLSCQARSTDESKTVCCTIFWCATYCFRWSGWYVMQRGGRVYYDIDWCPLCVVVIHHAEHTSTSAD